MNREKLYDNTVNVLLNAFRDKVLSHGNCHACAVGNIVADSLGVPVVVKPNSRPAWNSFLIPFWAHVFSTALGKQQFHTFHEISHDAYQRGIHQLEATGYTVQELAKIEFAFETCEKSEDKMQYQFNGLMAVIDVLGEIHGIDDAQRTKASKRKFETILAS